MRRRFVVSTIFGEFADTIVFMSIAFIGVIPLGGLLLATLSAYLFKVIYEIVMLPATSRLAVLIKKIENVDHFDHDTNLNPFAVFQRGRHDDDITAREVVLTHGYTVSLSDNGWTGTSLQGRRHGGPAAGPRKSGIQEARLDTGVRTRYLRASLCRWPTQGQR